MALGGADSPISFGGQLAYPIPWTLCLEEQVTQIGLMDSGRGLLLAFWGKRRSFPPGITAVLVTGAGVSPIPSGEGPFENDVNRAERRTER